MTHPDPEHTTAILLAFLEGNGPGLDVGWGEAPEAPSPAYPHLILFPLSPALIEGGLRNTQQSQAVEWQVSSIGRWAQEAQGGISAVRDRVLDDWKTLDFSAAGYKLSGEPSIEPGPTLTADFTEQPPLFSASETYRLKLVPA